MKKKSRALKKIVFSVSVMAILALSLIAAYLTDEKKAFNLFTVGKADVEIDEGDFEQKQVIYPNISVEKKPVVKNTGTIDEYVFVEVSIPRKEIKELTDVTQNNGTKTTQNIFKVEAEAADGETLGVAETGFTYHQKTEGTQGWVFLEKKELTECSKYVFGYSSKLAAGDVTAAVFDKVTLKNMIEEELKGNTEVNIGMNALCIQTNKLDGLELSGGLTEDNLKAIYRICVNKGLSDS